MSNQRSCQVSIARTPAPRHHRAPFTTDQSQRILVGLRTRLTLLLTDIGPLMAIIGAVILGNGLFLLGLFNPNPINLVSGLGAITHTGLLPGTYSIDPNNGFTAQALGHLAALDILHGHIPWWNPYEGVGAPLAGEMQSAALFPGTLLLAFSNGQLFFHVILETITGIATYRLLLRLQVSRWIAVACGIAFALNGTFSWFEHAPVNPIAFLPLVLLGVERARSAARAHQPHRWGLIAVALALSIYAGFPEVAYLDGLLAALWMVARTVGLHHENLHLYVKKNVIGAVVGVLLAAPILVAFADYLPWANLGAHTTGFNNAFLPHSSASMLLFPYSFGPIFGFTAFARSGLLNIAWGNIGGYLTTSILIFAILGLYARRLRVLRIFLGLWIVFSIGRAYGVPPFARLFSLLPFMNNVAAFRYAPPSWEFAAVVLAALGLDDIRRRAIPMWYVIAALTCSLVIAIGIFSTGESLRKALDKAPHYHVWVLVSIIWGFGVMLLIVIGLLAFHGRIRTGILISCMLLDVFAMFILPDLSAPRQASIDTGPVAWLEQHIGEYRFYTLGPIAPDYGSYFRLASADINDVPIPKTYGTYIVHDLDPNSNPLTFTGTNLLNPLGPSSMQEFLLHISRYQDIGVAYLVTEPGQLPSSTMEREHMRLVYSDEAADIYRLPAPREMYNVLSGNCRLSDETIDNLTADCKSSAVIVRRELYMPGWSASTTGQSLTVRSNAHLFQSVVLEPGRSTVTFTFLPPHEEAAFVGFLIALILLIGAWRRGSRRPSRWPRGKHRPGAARIADPALDPRDVPRH